MEKLVNTDKTENVYSLSPSNLTSRYYKNNVLLTSFEHVLYQANSIPRKEYLIAFIHVKHVSIFYPKYFDVFVTSQ